MWPGLATAAVENLAVTPGTLAGWVVVGAERKVVTVPPTLAVPAGAELSRSFAAGAVLVRVVGTPGWAETAAEWPILQVGEAAVAWMEQGGNGRLALMHGGDPETTLPWRWPLDAAEPWGLALAYDPDSGAGLVATPEGRRLFATEPSSRGVEVVLAAGASRSWPVDSLRVARIFEESATATRREPRPAAELAAARTAAWAALSSALEVFLAEERQAAAGKPKPAALGRNPAPARPLEVFTPPAVRSAKVAAVRAALGGRREQTAAKNP